MSNNDKKLDVISGIDEKIIDKCTRRKIALLTKLKIRTKRIIALTTSASILCASFLTAFIVIWFNQVPVYTGMTLSRTNPMKKIADAGDEVILLSTNGMADMYHDVMDSRTRILLDNDKGNDQSQNNGKDTFNAQGTKDIFYCKPNQDFYITVHIDNPKNYEILSFTLNGKKYSSYMFEEGSDMENLVLKCNVGDDASGIVEYTIDAIKYVDGTTIKDVRLKGEKTIEVGVYNEYSQPKATVNNIKKDYTSIKADITLSDEHNALGYGKYELYAELLTDENETVSRREISLGKTRGILFEGLSDGTTYKIQVVGYYDNFDGSGYSRHVLGSKSLLTTESALTLQVFDTTFDSASYSVVRTEGFEDLEIRKLYVTFADEERTPAEKVTIDGQTISGLYSDRKYYLCAEYTVNGVDVVKEIGFKTAERAPLVIEITNTTFDSVSYSVSDEHGLEHLEIRNVYVTLDDHIRTPVENTSVNGQTISGLHSGRRYYLRVEYTVDGANALKEVSFKTAERAPLVIDITNTTFNSVSYSVSDEHGLENLEIRKVYVTLDDASRTPVENTSVNGQTISGLHSGRRYYLCVEYTVDGMNKTKEVAFNTQVSADPVIELKNSNCGLTWVSFELNTENPDGAICKIKSVSIYDGKTFVAKQSPSDSYTFKNLKAPKVYTVRVEYTVDKMDGNGARTKTAELSVFTQSEGLEIRDGQIYGIGSCKDKVVYINMPIVGHAFNFCTDIVAVIGGDNVRDYYLQFDGCPNLRYVYGIQATVSCTVMVGDIDGEYQEYWLGCGYTVNSSWLDKTFIKDENEYVTTVLNDGRKALVAYFGNSKNIVIPEGVNVIMPSVFCDFEIESVKMPSSVTEIEVGAFEFCTSLKTVDLSPSLTRIGENAFNGCYDLENIVIPDGVTVLESRSFSGSSEIKTLVLPKNLQVIKGYALEISLPGDEMLILPDSIRRIEANGLALFHGKVYVPKSVEYVGEYAFYGCDVYFESEEMPDSWSQGSIMNANSVVWGYKLK